LLEELSQALHKCKGVEVGSSHWHPIDVFGDAKGYKLAYILHLISVSELGLAFDGSEIGVSRENSQERRVLLLRRQRSHLRLALVPIIESIADWQILINPFLSSEQEEILKRATCCWDRVHSKRATSRGCIERVRCVSL
jgi:hypothetical protein